MSMLSAAACGLPRSPHRERSKRPLHSNPGRLLAVVLLAGLTAIAGAEEPQRSNAPVLSFRTVAGRVLASHPRIAGAALAVDAARAEEALARQKPALELGLEVENVFGSDDFSGVDNGEFTLVVESLYERGGKRQERDAVARAGTRLADVEQRIETLDLLAETARRYLAVATAQEQQHQAEARHTQAVAARDVARRRVGDAQSPRTELLDAELRVAELELELSNGARRLAAARTALESLWADDAADLPPVPQGWVAAVDFGRLPEPRPLGALREALATVPDLERYAAEERLRTAEQALARAEAYADWRWSLGIRHLEETGDQALVAGFTVPLGSGARAAPRQRLAELRQARTALDRQERLRTLETLLHGQWQLLVTARETALAIAQDMEPRARESRELVARGYRIGRFSFADLRAADERLAGLEARRLAAATDYHAARIEIERLTGAHLELLTE